MATKKNNDMTAKDCIQAIDGAMAAIKGLTGNSQAFKELEDEWKVLSRALKKLGQKKGLEKKAVGKAVAQALVTANDRTVKQPAKAAGKSRPKAKTVKITRREADAATPQLAQDKPTVELPKAKQPKSVVITPHTLELYLGSFPIEDLAKRDAAELLNHPQVFWYRRAVFPDPTAAKVQPKIMSAKAVERKGAQFTRAPYTVWVDINIQGDAAHVKAWAEGVVNKNRGDQE